MGVCTLCHQDLRVEHTYVLHDDGDTVNIKNDTHIETASFRKLQNIYYS